MSFYEIKYSWPHRANPIPTQTTIMYADSYIGAESEFGRRYPYLTIDSVMSIESDRSRPCGVCKGTGTVTRHPTREQIPCETCEGTGRLTGQDYTP